MSSDYVRHKLTAPLLPNHPQRSDTMVKKFSFLVLVCSAFLLMLFVSHLLATSTSLEHFQSLGFINPYEGNITAEIFSVLLEQRKLIEQEMTGYKYPQGRYNISANALSDLVPEVGGQPLRSLIITTWRSGSTFLGEILNSHPASYMHYEPLLHFDIVQIRGPPLARNATNVLKDLLNCDYSNLNTYLEYGKSHEYLFSHNERLWDQCEQHPNICWIPEFLNPFCKLFPFQAMKVVRLRLRLVEELLEDKRLNIRVLLLVRDPRGTLQSRRHRSWCPGFPDCSDPELLCADLVSDYSAAVHLTAKYPGRFIVVRYEDLSMDPYRTAREMFRFYGLDFHPRVSLFLDTHTKVDIGGVSSTYRNSRSAPFHWRHDLSFKEVSYIQDRCVLAMRYWGYSRAHNATHQREFNPLVDFKLT